MWSPNLLNGGALYVIIYRMWREHAKSKWKEIHIILTAWNMFVEKAEDMNGKCMYYTLHMFEMSALYILTMLLLCSMNYINIRN